MRELLLALALTAAAGPAPAPAPSAIPTPAAAAKLPVVPLPPRGNPHAPPRRQEPRPAPPSLSSAALIAELRESSRRRAEDLTATQAERLRLEQLTRELAEARQALRTETARLEKLVASAKQVPASPAAGERAGEGDPKQVELLAKTLKGMKADQAAGMVGQLKRPLAAAVLRRLKPGDAAAILGRMKTPDAAELFTMLSRNEPGATR